MEKFKVKLLCQVLAMFAGVLLVILGAIGVTQYVGLFVLMIFGGLLFGGGFGSFLGVLIYEIKDDSTNK